MTIKERFVAIAKALAADPDGLDLLEMGSNNILEYVSAVCTMETRMIINKFRLEGEEWRELVTELDRSRRMAHDAAISGISFCNRMAAKMGAPLLYEGDLADRNAVGDFCGKFVAEFFNGRAVTKDGWVGPSRMPIDEWIDVAKGDGV